MTLAMFIFLVIWIAVCTSKPEPESWLSGIQVRETDRTPEQILADYGKR